MDQMPMERSRLKTLQRPLQEPDHRTHSTITWLAEVDTPNGLKVVALKDLQHSRMLPEAVAASVAGLLGLATPKTFLVEVSKQQMLAGKLQNGLAVLGSLELQFFGSEYLSLPVFDRGPRETQFGRMVAMSRSLSFAQIILFDTLIGNVDRAERNILADNGRLIPFDHDQAFLGLHWTPETLLNKKNAPNHSMFDTYLTWSDPAARDLMLQMAQAWSELMRGKVETIIATLPPELGIRADERAAIITFIDWRANNLQELIKQRLGSFPFQA